MNEIQDLLYADFPHTPLKKATHTCIRNKLNYAILYHKHLYEQSFIFQKYCDIYLSKLVERKYTQYTLYKHEKWF